MLGLTVCVGSDALVSRGNMGCRDLSATMMTPLSEGCFMYGVEEVAR